MVNNKEYALNTLQLAGEKMLESLHLLQARYIHHVPQVQESASRILPPTERLLQVIQIMQEPPRSDPKPSASGPRKAPKPTLFFR